MSIDPLSEDVLFSPHPIINVVALRDNPDYIKCPRCWNYTHEGLHNYDGWCDRCCLVMIQYYPDDDRTKSIVENRKLQQDKWKL